MSDNHGSLRTEDKDRGVRGTGISRRRFLGTMGALAVGTLAGGVLHAHPAGALQGFPAFGYLKLAVDRSKLKYNPTNDVIFPCIRGVGGRISNPLGAYYLYYAPHDAPGGICLAYSDSVTGPYTEYPNNPIVSKDWPGNYAVSHVSSPHVIWHSDSKRFYMYFHGENTTTRLATSTDGINWSYAGVVLSTSMIGNGVTEASYARVFEQSVPSKNANYVMLFMGNQSGTRRIFWGWSADARNWSFQKTPLINPSPDGCTQLSGPHLYRNGATNVVYQGDTGKMYATRVGDDFTREEHLGVFHTPLSGEPDNGRSAAPSFIQSGSYMYMFYESGPRLSSDIAIARATL